MPLQRLDEAMGVGRRGFRPGAADAGPAQQDRGKVLRVYRWQQFAGREEVTEFDEAHFATEGLFAQSSSEGHKDYQDRLRCIHLRREGKQKAEIAQALGRSEKFVAKWWQKDPKEVPRPWGVHEYLTKDMGRNSNGLGATNGASMTEDTVTDTATWWRDVEVRRKFAADPAIYDEILQNTEWKASNARTRDFATGAYHLKYDQRGNIKWEGHQGGKYKQGLSPAMDKAIQKLFVEYGIADRTSGVITNWYPDGQGNLGSHRHDCWTALFSFGHERILTIDNTPLLMQDGDLCIFGTQRHGVPVMPEITEGRITLVVFFYPDKMQKQGMWQTITDPETMAPSRPLVKMLHDRDLGVAAEERVLEESNDLIALQQLGFSKADASVALQACQFDVERAAEVLLLHRPVVGIAPVDTLRPGDDQLQSIPQQRAGRFRKRAIADNVQAFNDECDSTAACSTCCHSSSSSSSASASTPSRGDSSDEALARRLQSEEEDATAAGLSKQLMPDDEVAALAMQLEEMERETYLDPSLLATQFQEYEDRFTKEDAERWNGHGDLMHSPFSREHLKLEEMDQVTLYSAGHGDMFEKDFWEMLQCNSIRVLYDIRPTDHRGELYSRHQRFSTASLKAQCRTRGIFFKSMPVGRESAYGTLAHIKSDEGKHTLVELAWQAKRKHTCFLGREENWKDDPRQVVAEELAKAGHIVAHIQTDGSTEHHCAGVEFPDWLVREEDRLKLVEKKRHAGELIKPQKSSADRSSEAIASRLARPAEEVDAMAEMKQASNQKELIVAQRKLARFQRIAEEKGELASKVVTHTPFWILEDARKQAEWVAARKKEKEDAKQSSQDSASCGQAASPDVMKQSLPSVSTALSINSTSSSVLTPAIHEACEMEPCVMDSLETERGAVDMTTRDNPDKVEVASSIASSRWRAGRADRHRRAAATVDSATDQL